MIESLCTENFLSIEKIELDDIKDLGVVGILGGFENKEGYSNGSGKSALAESIYMALTGKHRYKTDIEAIRIGTDKAEVKLTHINNKNRLTIIRTIKKKADNKSTLSNVNVILNETVVASGTREGQQYINNYFSITPDDFKASYFFRQKEYDSLLKSRSSDRIKFLQKFFKSYIFDEAKKSSSTTRNQLANNLIISEGKSQSLLEEKEDMLAESELKTHICRLKSSVIELTSMEVELNKKIKTIDLKVKKENDKNTKAHANQEKEQMYKDQIQDIKNEVEKTSVSKSKYTREIVGLCKRIKELEKLTVSNIKDWSEKEQDRLDDHKESIDKKFVALQVNTSKIQLISEALKNLEFNLCPICGTRISNELRENQTQSKTDEITKLQGKNIKLGETIDLMQDKLIILKGAKKQKTKDWKVMQEKLSEQQKLTVLMNGKKDINKAFINQIGKQRNKIKVIEKNKLLIGNTKVDKAILMRLNNEKLKINGKIKTIQISMSEKKSDLTKKQTLLERIKDLNKKILLIKKEEKSLRQRISDRFVLEGVFEKCKMEIISIGIEELEEHANNIIKEVGAIQKEIEFEKTKEGQKGEVVDALNIYLIDSKGKRMVDGLSGGEWNLSAFALTASLARYKLLRMNSIIDFMILDEIFGSLDDNSRDELVNIINMMKDNFSQVFVITHTDLKDAFEHTINVEMSEEGVTKLKTLL